MISLSYLAKLFQQDENDFFHRLKSNNVPISIVKSTLMVDERCLLHNLLSDYDEYLKEEKRIREEEINTILEELDDLAFLLKSFKKMSPTLRLLIKEMSLHIPAGLKRTIFIETTRGTHLSVVAKEHGLTFSQACKYFSSAMKYLKQKVGFTKEFRSIIAEKNLEIRKLQIVNRNQENKINYLTDALKSTITKTDDKEKSSETLIPLNAVQMLSVRLSDLDLDTRCINCMSAMNIRTVEDLLRYIKLSSFKILVKNAKNFGNKSRIRLKQKLMEKGILDENEQSALFEYLS